MICGPYIQAHSYLLSPLGLNRLRYMHYLMAARYMYLSYEVPNKVSSLSINLSGVVQLTET